MSAPNKFARLLAPGEAATPFPISADAFLAGAGSRSLAPPVPATLEQLIIRVTPVQKKKLRTYCAEHDLTMQAVLQRAIDNLR